MLFKRWIAVLMAVFVCFSLWPSIGTAQSSGEIRIYLDGVQIRSDDAPPFIMPGVNLTMVPVRVISQGLGAKVDWSQKDQTVTISHGDKKITLKVGQKTAIVDGKEISLDAPPINQNSRVMVPLRFIGENLGLEVKWNPVTRWIQLISYPGHELKGAWVSSVYNLDWPSAQSYGSPTTQMREFVTMLDELQQMGLNAVFVQVRPSADALYPSKLVPWSKYLTGVEGRNPGYDPLAFMIDETHRRGMEFHAWFNPFRASVGSTTDGLAANHVAKQHPEWIVSAGGKLYINPGIPVARQHIIDAIMEVVNGYPIDGVHLDDYFYPSHVVFDDDEAFKAYNADKIKEKDAWRRHNINEFVKQLGESIRAVKPQVSYGISPFGVWRNQKNDPTGSDTNAGVSTYDDMHADVRTWIRNEWIDYVMPQIYWSQSLQVANYNTLVQWWANEVEGTRVKLYIGHAPYKLGTQEVGWHTADEIINQLKYNENFPQIRGDVFFSAKDLRKNPFDLVNKLREYYNQQ